MSHESKSSNDELRQLLRVSGDTPPAVKSSRKSKPAKTSEPTDLHALLREGFAPPNQTSHRDFRDPRTADAASINDLLRLSGTAAVETHAQLPSTILEKAPEGLQLDQVLREVQGRPVISEARPTSRPITAADLSDTLHDAQLNPDAAHPDANPKDMLDSPWVARTSWLMLFLLVIAIAFWWQHRPLDGVPGTLQDLAQAVDQHHKMRGSLPEQLSTLEGFPKRAIEWPAKYWNARDALGRTEIIWAPNGNKHYRIVLRQGNEVWLYSDKEAKARLIRK